MRTWLRLSERASCAASWASELSGSAGQSAQVVSSSLTVELARLGVALPFEALSFLMGLLVGLANTGKAPPDAAGVLPAAPASPPAPDRKDSVSSPGAPSSPRAVCAACASRPS